MFDDLRAAAAVLAGVDPVRLPSTELADRVAELRGLIDGLEGLWSRLVRALDGSGAIESGTSSWLRSTCRLSAAGARSPGGAGPTPRRPSPGRRGARRRRDLRRPRSAGHHRAQ